MNRGSRLVALAADCLLYCFNEAPIHESGKFTEDGERLLDNSASMRPRFMNRGSDILIRMLDVGETLLQ